MQEFKIQDRVIYVPIHANGDATHVDCEHGTVSSINRVNVFVKFDKQLAKFGWDGTISQVCDPSTLVKEDLEETVVD